MFVNLYLSCCRLLIAFQSSRSGYLWQAVIFAVLLFLCKFVFSILRQRWAYMSYVNGMLVQSILNGVVYRKVCGLSEIRTDRVAALRRKYWNSRLNKLKTLKHHFNRHPSRRFHHSHFHVRRQYLVSSLC